MKPITPQGIDPKEKYCECKYPREQLNALGKIYCERCDKELELKPKQ